MKQLTIALLLFLPGFIYAQSDSLKLPKLYVTEGFLTSGFELGDKKIGYNEVAPHLKVHNAESYHLWMRQEAQTKTSIVFSIIGIAGAVTGLVAKNSVTKSAGWVAASTSFLATTVIDLSAKGKRTKAVDIYNKGAGY
jgi:hypothetical protein